MFNVISLGSCIAELAPTEPGMPLSQAHYLEMFPSGSSANFAFAAARLGLKVALVSRVGEDELGQFMLTRLQQAGVDTSHILTTPNQYTSLSVCWADGKGKKYFYLYRFPGFSDPLNELSSSDLEDEFLAQGRVMHFSEACVREPAIRAQVFAIAERFRSKGGHILYCPNYRGVWRVGREEMITAQRQAVSLADFVALNQEEADIISGESTDNVGSALRALGPSLVAVTNGDKGAYLFSDEGDAHIPAHTVPVIYDVGAGDTFQAGLVAGINWGMSHIDCARLGAAAAALRVSRSGDPANLPTAEEARELMGK